MQSTPNKSNRQHSQQNQGSEFFVEQMATISEESDSSDEEDDLRDTTVAIQYVNKMHEKL